MPFSIVRKPISEIDADTVVEYAPAQGRDDGALKTADGIRLFLPEWTGGKDGEEEHLQQSYQAALALAFDQGCKNIAFPVLADADFHYPKELSMKLATEAFSEFLKQRELDIILAVPDQTQDKVSGALFDEVRSYLDEKEAGGNHYAWAEEQPGAEQPQPQLPPELTEGMWRPQPNPLLPPELTGEMWTSQPSMPQPSQPQMLSMPQPSMPQMPLIPPQPAMAKKSGKLHLPGVKRSAKIKPSEFSDTGIDPAISLESRLKSMYTDTFEKHMQQLINKKGMKNSEVYVAANISKQYFSKLMKGQVKPSKEKVLAIAVGLRLNLDETVDFLRLAGYALSPVSQTDVVVEYFIQKKDYNVMKIDIVLFDYGLPTLSDAKSYAS